MDGMSKAGRRAGLAFVIALLPAVAAFWVFLSVALSRVAKSDAVRSLAAIMNQADRLANDLDLELSFLDSIFAESLQPNTATDEAESAISSALAAYRAVARWPDFIDSVYILDMAGGGLSIPAQGDAITRVLRVDRYRGEGGESTGRFRALVAVLDGVTLTTEVFPDLVAGYFGPDSGFSDYAIGLRDGYGQLRYTNAVAEAHGADFMRPLLRDVGRFDVGRFYLSFAPRFEGGTDAPDETPPAGRTSPSQPDAGAPPIDRYRFLASSAGGWTLEISHRGTSIEESARRRSVLWSLAAGGFLALLYGSVIALYLSSRRTAELAARERSFVASVTHELKTPIAVALSAGENLQKGIVAADKVAAYGETVAREARRLADSVERLLIVAGLESAQPFRHGEPIALRDAVESALARLAGYAAERGASFSVSVEGAPTADGSRVLVESAIECVLGNAVKYAGGKVSVALAETRKGGRRMATLSCSDAGPGIPRSERARAFEPFWRGRAAVAAGIQGTGVGLYLARRVARVHGGDARIRCPQEGGTVVELSFRSYV